MSAFFDKADALCSRLSRVQGLESVIFIVNRQRDIGAEMQKANAKKSCLGLITWHGGKNERRDDRPRINNQYAITVYSKPVLRAGDLPQDELLQLISMAVHHWSPNEDSPNAFRTRFEIVSITPLDDPEYLAFQILTESITQLPSTEIILNP